MNIIIAGMTCSGKTTLANRIRNELGETCIIREDDYMKDLQDVPHLRGYYLMDLPSAYHLDEYSNDVNTLISNGQIFYPTYDVRNNKRINKENIIRSRKFNVFEGLHTIDTLNIPGTLKIFMDIPPNICLERRIKRDTSLYGMNPSDIERYFNEIIMSIYKTHIYKQKMAADVVIEKESDIKCLLKKL